MAEPPTIPSITPSVVDSKPSPPPTSVATVTVPTATSLSPPPLVVRAQNPSRNVPVVQKHDATPRQATSPSVGPDHRDHKAVKDISKPEDVSEYINHGIDPSAPIYEITHAIPDALILKCADCQRFARVQPNLAGMELLPGPGDRGVQFKCSRCGGGQQTFRHTEKTWLEITLTSLYNLELQDKHKEGRRFFHVRQEICSFADNNWEVICLGRTRTPTWWATLNAQITTRTDLFETSKHGSGNWALRHSNITHPVQAADSSLDASKEIPVEKPATAKLNATAIVSKKVIGERRFYLVTLEGNNGTVWRESTHPSFRSGELIRKFTKVDPVKDGNGASGSGGSSSSSAKSKAASARSKAGAKSGAAGAASAYLNQYSTQTPLGVTLGVFTEKVVKAPSRLSRRQQSKHDAALAAANAAAQQSGSTPGGSLSGVTSGAPTYANGAASGGYANGMNTTTTPNGKVISPMADAYRKTSKAAAGLLDNHTPRRPSSSSSSSSTTASHHMHHHHHHTYNGATTANSSTMMASTSYMKTGISTHPAAMLPGAMMGKMGNGTLNMSAAQMKLGQNPQPMRCHQCNRRQLSRPKPGQEFVFCTRTMSKVEGDMTLNVACTNSYCLTCIELIYHEHPLESEQDLSTWICPACRKICTCATCNHYVDPSGQTQSSMVVTSSTPTAQLQQQQQQFQFQLQQQQQRGAYAMHHNATSTASATSASGAAPNAYGESSESPGEDSSSTTTASYGSTPSAKSTPTGSVSLSPNVSTWAPGVAPNGVPTGHKTSSSNPADFKGDRKTKIDVSQSSKIDVQYHEEFETPMKIVIPTAYESPNQGRKDGKNAPTSVPQPSPHNTRSNSGTRSTQHPLSLYTQSLVSRGPSNRKRSSGSTGAASHNAVDLRASAPIHMPAHLHQMRTHPHSSFVSTTMPESMSAYPLMHHAGHMGMNGAEKSVTRRRLATESLSVSTTHNGSMAYGSLPSPTSDLVPGGGPNDHRMFMSKGKRPHSELSASTGDLGRPRRATLLDAMEPSGKRRALVNTSMDDMGDLMQGDLQSPRHSLAHFAEDEDDDMSPHHHHTAHHHHQSVGVHHHHHHSLDDSMGKDVSEGLISAPALDGEDDHTPIILHSQPPPVVTSTSINPAQIMMAEYFDQPGMEGVDSDPHVPWTDVPISVNNFESSYF